MAICVDSYWMSKPKTILYCFSPEVMLVTFVVEALLAAFVFVRHRMTRFGKAAGTTLLLLAVFQFAEYRICMGPPDRMLIWSRIGFVAITILPVTGLYLVSLVGRKPHFLKLGYVTAAGFAIYFLFVPKAITGAVCGGNYVVFNGSTDLYRLYGLYYWGFLLLGIWEALEKLPAMKRQSRSGSVLKWLIVGYLSFMAPMGLAYTFFPETRNAVASVMCGFAIALALILSLKIVPAYGKTQH
jgi:hypothetical protein